MSRVAIGVLAYLSAVAVVTPVAAQSRFCVDRPGKGTPPCTTAPGQVMVESSLVDWSHSRDSDEVEDTTLVNDALVRVGVGASTELRFGWTMLGVDRTRDRATREVERGTRAGDVTLGARRALLRSDDGAPFDLSLQPFVAVPTGRRPIGAGTWAAGLVVPAQVSVTRKLSFTLDSEADAAADEKGAGRHLAYSVVADLNWHIVEKLRLTAEAFAQRDRDPSGHETLVTMDASGSYELSDDCRVDFSAYAGVTQAAPRIQLVMGLARRF